MNKGSELIIVWLMSKNGFEDEFTETFLDSLYAGCEKGEADAIGYRDSMIANAMTMDHENMSAAIQAAFELHMLKVHLERDTAALNAYRKINEALADNPASLLGKRIISMKIKEIVTEYDKATL